MHQHPKRGFYAAGVESAPVGSYAEINAKMEEGMVNRTIAATEMNVTSSRAHTIVKIKFTQKSINAVGVEMEKTSVINLLDMAGY